MPRPSTAAVALMALGACAPTPDRPPSVCQLFPDVPCGSQSPPGSFGSGGGGGGGGIDAGYHDGSAADGAVNVVGAVVIATSIPIGNGADASRPAANWVVAPALSSGAPQTTDATGRFALSNVALYNGGVVLAATPPAGTSALGALAAFAPTGSAATLIAVDQNTLEEAALLAGFAIDARGTATIIVQLLGTGATVAGVMFSASTAMSTANVAYDDLSGTLRVGTQTNVFGTIGVFNIPAPAGVTLESVTLVHAGNSVSYAAPVGQGMITWLAVPPP